MGVWVWGMQSSVGRLNLMLAHGAQADWATALEGALRPLPVELHWSRTDHEAIGLATATRLDLGVVDDDLTEGGGLGLVRRIRMLGMGFPCLLVSREPQPRLLQKALELEVFSVVDVKAYQSTLVPLVCEMLTNMARTGDEDGDWAN